MAGAFVLAYLATACASPSSIEARARAHAAGRLGVEKHTLRVTARGDLSTERHAVVRVTDGNGKALTVVVARDGELVVDGLMGDAFARLAQAENLGQRFAILGAARVAGWYGALGGGPCGEVLGSEKDPVAATVLDAGFVLDYRFAAAGHVERCHLELDAAGQVRRVSAEIAPLARR